MSTTQETYEGWTNYETWAVKLWIDNDQDSYKQWTSLARIALRTHGAKDAPRHMAVELEGWHKDERPSGFMPQLNGTVYSDLLNHALDRVNWHEIAEAMIEEASNG